jgi:hypothetical protein
MHHCDTSSVYIYYYQCFFENRTEFAKIYIKRERPQSNESFQIITELRHRIKIMKNRRSFKPGGIAPKLVKYGGEYLDKYLLQIITN